MNHCWKIFPIFVVGLCAANAADKKPPPPNPEPPDPPGVLAIVVPTDAIAVLEGGTSTFIKPADSGRESDCVFCPKCGNRLFHHIKADAAMSMVKTGLLDDASDIIPVAHLWTSRALNWVTIPNDVLIFEGQPEVGMGSLIEAYKGS